MRKRSGLILSPGGKLAGDMMRKKPETQRTLHVEAILVNQRSSVLLEHTLYSDPAFAHLPQAVKWQGFTLCSKSYLQSDWQNWSS